MPPLGSSRNTWTNIYKNKGRIDYCVQQFGVCCPPHARARDPRPGPRAAAAGSGRAGREADDGGGFRAGVFFFARRDHSQAQVEAAGRVGAQRVRRCILRDKACASIRHMHCTYVTAAGRAGQRGLRQQGGAPERGGPPGTETFSGDAALGHTRARWRLCLSHVLAASGARLRACYHRQRFAGGCACGKPRRLTRPARPCVCAWWRGCRLASLTRALC